MSSTNGNAVGSEIEVFGWKDTLEPVLEFAGTPSVTRTLGGSVEMTQVGKEKRTVSSNIVNVRILTTKKKKKESITEVIIHFFLKIEFLYFIIIYILLSNISTQFFCRQKQGCF